MTQTPHVEIGTYARAKFSSTYVYVIGGDNKSVKIGVSHQPRKRCMALRNSSGRCLEVLHLVQCSAPERIESLVHEHLKDKRGVGEWFHVTASEALSAVEFVAGASGERFNIVKDITKFRLREQKLKLRSMPLVWNDKSVNLSLKSLTDQPQNNSEATGPLPIPHSDAVRIFFLEMIGLASGSEMLLRDVRHSYRDIAKDKNWPALGDELSDKTFTCLLVRLGCRRSQRDLRKTGRGRPTTIIWPVMEDDLQ